jgi:hypothetical protein
MFDPYGVKITLIGRSDRDFFIPLGDFLAGVTETETKTETETVDSC